MKMLESLNDELKRFKEVIKKGKPDNSSTTYIKFMCKMSLFYKAEFTKNCRFDEKFQYIVINRNVNISTDKNTAKKKFKLHFRRHIRDSIGFCSNIRN